MKGEFRARVARTLFATLWERGMDPASFLELMEQDAARLADPGAWISNCEFALIADRLR